MKITRRISFVALLAGLAFQANCACAQDSALSSSEKKQLETAFVSMAGLNLPAFNNGKVSDTNLVKFGIQQNIQTQYENKNFLPTTQGSEFFRLATTHVDAATSRFFGRKVAKHQSIRGYDWIYRNGYYKVSLNEAEFNLTCPITKIVSYGKGTYKVFFNAKENENYGGDFVGRKSIVLKKVGASKFRFVSYGNSK